MNLLQFDFIVWDAHINTVLYLDSLHLQVRVLADDSGSEVAGDVVPLDAIIVLVVQHRQTRLVIELLQTLHSQTTLILHILCNIINIIIYICEIASITESL